MKIRHGLLFFCLFLLLLSGVITNTGCANIVPPLGGPKDTIPPRLVTVIPNDSSKNFKEKKIVFTFDEYIDGKDIRTELVVNPVPKVEPIVDAKLKQVTVRIKDTLEPNVTYSLYFGKGIKDVNEGNILRNFGYVFSTGNHIDRGEFAGNVIVAVNGKVDSTLVAVLHERFDDSAVIKNRPRYIAKVDSNGRFQFRFVKPGSYALYAMEDKSGTHKYLSKSQLFAFADSPVVVGRNTPPVLLYAYSEEAEPAKAQQKPANTPAAKPPKKNTDTRLTFQSSVTNGVFDVLDTFRLTFQSGLKYFDTSLIRFTDERFKDIDPGTYHFTLDSARKKATLFYTWPTDTKYKLIGFRGFAEDSVGRKLLKTDTISFSTKKNIDYGEIRIRILNLDMSKRPVLQFVQSDAVKYSFPFNNRREVRKILFPPGEYELRILYDTNGNGKWDPGSFFGKRRQPEKVIAIHKKYNVKANWDNDLDITL